MCFSFPDRFYLQATQISLLKWLTSTTFNMKNQRRNFVSSKVFPLLIWSFSCFVICFYRDSQENIKELYILPVVWDEKNFLPLY